MSKSRNKSKSEVEHLRGQVRELKAKLKYLRRRQHIENSIIDDVIEDGNVENINAVDCDECGKGVLVEYDFKFATLKKCTHCDHEVRKRKT